MSKTILVIEDESHVRQLLVNILEKEKFHVINASNGSSGLELAEAHVPDLILCDILMQGLDGYEVLRRLRQNLRTAAIPLIFLTAKSERLGFRKAMALGADDYITKPFNHGELLEAVRARLARQALIYQTYALNAQLPPTAQIGSSYAFPSSVIGESHLYQALESCEFELHYQPQFAMDTGTLVGAEALIRWRSPQFGIVSPAEFITLAEETGFIILLDQWVIQTACAQAREWQDLGIDPLRIAINVSSLQFNHPHLPERIEQVLSSTGMPPQCLEVELTESILGQDMEATARRLQELKELGVQIAIDDFGIGYASLEHLQSFSFDILKLDKRFVHNVNNNTTNAAIATAVINMAHDLNLIVIAEGVETEAERQFLQRHGCDVLQGYLMSHPLLAADFEDLQRNSDNTWIANSSLPFSVN